METLRALGWDPAWDAVFANAGLPDAEPARVVSQHRDRWDILCGKGARTARRPGADVGGPRPVTGDWVAATAGPHETDPWSIVAVLPRRSAIRRGAAGDSHTEQVLAANVDRLWIVQALDRPPNLRSLERYLAVAWESGASPEIVLTKSDLAQDPAQALDSVQAIAFGVPVRLLSTGNLPALADLRASLAPGQTIALLGPSGAGKSTLVNRLAGGEVAATGEVRSGDRKGRHTTTARELFPIHGGALLLDTPGMRELKVPGLDEGLGHAFPEIEELSTHCRFRDCTHDSEPGCAVLAALREGRLSAERLASYRKLQAEAAYEHRRTDPQARAEHVSQWKTAIRTLRHHPKYRERE